MLKLITPFRVLFNLDSSKIAAQPTLFTEFLRKTQEALDNPDSTLSRKLHPGLKVEAKLPPAAKPTTATGKAAQDSSNAKDHGRFFLSPHVLTLSFKENYQPELQKIYTEASADADETVGVAYAKMFRPALEGLKIKLNDNTVAIMLLDLHLPSGVPDEAESWSHLNEWVAVLVKSMLTVLYPQMIFPLLKGMNEFSHETKDHFVCDVSEYKIFFVLVGDPQNPYPDLHKRFIPMKTVMTLCADTVPAKNEWVANILKHCTSVHMKNVDVRVSDENNFALLATGAQTHALETLWELIAAASYYYIAMNVINVNLIRYIGITSGRYSTAMLRTVSHDMENIINSVTILKVRYNDLVAELSGANRKVFQAMQKEWEFKNIADNIQYKLELCRANIKIISLETQRRNQGRIETVLTGVAGVTLVSITVDLAAYATQLPEENMHMVGDIPGFMDLGFLMSGNTLSWIGFFLAAAVLAFTIRHRSG